MLSGAARRRGLRRGMGVAVVSAAVLAAVLPGVTRSTASWTDSEWASGSIGTSSLRCDVDTDLATIASSTMVSGTLGGQDLDDVAGVQGVTVSKEADQAAQVDPVTAPALDTGGDSTVAAYGNPLQVHALDDVIGLDLTGLGTGLPAGSTGAVNQIARVTSTGDAGAGAGLVSDSGGVMVSDSTPSDELPQPASLDVTGAVTSALGDSSAVTTSSVSDIGVEVGAVASSARLDGCAALDDELWGGDAAVRPAALVRTATTTRAAADVAGDPASRDYGIASLGLRIRSPLVEQLVPTVNSTVTGLDRSVATLVGPNGLLARTVQDGVVSALGGLTTRLGLGSTSGTVSISGASLGAAVSPLLTQPLTDGTTTVDLADGTVDVDLARLLGDDVHGLNDLPPNTEIVMNEAVLGAISAHVESLLMAWTTRVADTLTAAVQALRVTMALTVDLTLAGQTVAQLTIRLDGTIGAFRAGTTPLTVTAKLIGADPLGVVSGLLGPLTATLVASLPPLLRQVLVTNLVDPVTALGPALTGSAGQIADAVSEITAALPRVLSLVVNVQTGTAGTRRADGGASTGIFTETALRIGLADVLSPAGLARIDLATTRVGPTVITGLALSS